jgi:hypothetical protein
LGDFEHGPTHPPAFSDQGLVYFDPRDRQVVPERAGLDREPELVRPPQVVLLGIDIDGFVVSPWTVRSAWSSPAILTPRTSRRPATVNFQIAEVTKLFQELDYCGVVVCLPADLKHESGALFIR